MQQLASLDAQQPQQSLLHLPAELQQTITPLHPRKWEELLQSYPDHEFAQYVINGLHNGFRIGFNREAKLKSCTHNMLSAAQLPQVIDDYLLQELALERVAIVPQDWAPNVHTSPFGIIPKKHKPGKWRLILDLSSPTELSVNDGIDKDHCSLSYTSNDEVVKCIISQGRGAMLAKIDIKQAYRNVPVHPEDRPLLGMAWNGKVYLDKVLPFGLRSAPIIFSAIADALPSMDHSGPRHKTLSTTENQVRKISVQSMDSTLQGTFDHLTLEADAMVLCSNEVHYSYISWYRNGISISSTPYLSALQRSYNINLNQRFQQLNVSYEHSGRYEVQLTIDLYSYLMSTCQPYLDNFVFQFVNNIWDHILARGFVDVEYHDGKRINSSLAWY